MDQRQRSALPVVVLVLALGVAPAAAAQAPSREALALEIHGTGVRIEEEARRAGTGLTVGVALGHGIGEHVMVSFGFDIGGGRFDGEAAMTGHADLAVRFFPWRPRTLSPFFEAAFTGHGREIAGATYLGTGFTAGFGAEYVLSSRLALVAAAGRTWGHYDEADDEQIPTRDVSIDRLRLGVVLRPPR